MRRNIQAKYSLRKEYLTDLERYNEIKIPGNSG